MQEKKLNRLGLKSKIIYPLLIAIVVIFSLIVFVTIISFEKINEHNVNQTVELKINKLNREIEHISNNALYIASVVSEMEVVKIAYENYYNTQDIEESAEILKKNFGDLSDKITQETGIKPFVHFNLLSGISFFRSWSDERGDTIYTYRKSIVKVSTEHKYLKGFEVGRAGFVIRGIAPIFSSTGQYYGSVEVFFKPEELLNEVDKDENDDFAIFINKEILSFAYNFKDDSTNLINLKETEIIGDFVLIGKTAGFKSVNVSSLNFSDFSSDDNSYTVDNLKYVVIPLFDISGDIKGYGVLQIDFSNRTILKNIIVYEILFFGVILLLMVFILIVLGDRFIIKKIKNTESHLKKLASGEQIDPLEIDSEDEIGQMMQSLNLLNKGIIKNTNFAIEISKGNLETNYSVSGENDVLGNSLLNMQHKLIEYSQISAAALEQFKELSDLTFEGILIHINSIAQDLNLSLARMFGYTREELIGENIVEKLFEPNSIKIIKEKIKLGADEIYEVVGLRKDGSLFPVQIEGKTVDKTINKRVVAIRDITDIRKSQSLIRKLSAAVEQSANSIIITDIEGRIEYANSRFYEVTGYTEKEVIGSNFDIIKSGVQSEAFYNLMWEVIRAGKIWEGDIYNKTKSGEFFWEHTVISPIKNEKNEIVNYLAIKEDITIRKNVEKALKVQNEEYHALYEEYKKQNSELYEAKLKVEKNQKRLIEAEEIAHLGHWELNLHTYTLLWSDEVYNIFNIQDKTIIPTYEMFIGYIHPEDKEYVKNEFKNSVLNNASFELTHRIILNNGEIKYLYEKSRTLYDENGIALTTKGTVQDITVQKQTEIRLKHQNEEYAALNEEYRTQNEELLEAKTKAEQSDKLKTEFLHNMSHEIRTPMNGIIGFTDFLSDPSLTEDNKIEYIKIIQSSSKRLLKVIDDILEISRLETGNVKIIEDNFSVDLLLKELYEQYAEEAVEIDFIIKKSNSKSETFIYSDKNKIKKVLSNLIDNALKFTKKGFVEVGYRLQSDVIDIYVKDSGIGVEESKKEVIFERFSQEEKDLAKKVGGLGLGLSISKEYVKLMNGHMSLTSLKGVGSTFFVSIPVKNINLKGNEYFKEEVKEFNNKRRFKIVIVEDEINNFLYLDALIKNNLKDVDVVHIQNGVEAVEYCKQSSDISLILMDLKIPLLSGFDATIEIRKFNDQTPIIAQTAYSTEDEIERAFKSGCNEFISKPIDSNNFLKLIINYLT